MVKNPPVNAGDTGWIHSDLWSGRSPHALEQRSLRTKTAEPVLQGQCSATRKAVAISLGTTTKQ